MVTTCVAGTYMNHTLASECYVCPAGWYCLHGDLVTECPPGHFCPAGTGGDWQMCPPGTYNNQTSLQVEEECKVCPGGWYCDRLVYQQQASWFSICVFFICKDICSMYGRLKLEKFLL